MLATPSNLTADSSHGRPLAWDFTPKICFLSPEGCYFPKMDIGWGPERPPLWLYLRTAKTLGQNMTTTAVELLGRGMQLRSCQLTLLTSLAFGAVLAVFNPPLTAQTTQNLPTTIPNLSGYDIETRLTMEHACISEKSNGPVAYGACLNRQIASLQKSPGIPNPSGYDRETRRTKPPASKSAGTNSD
jgi:hypothetical protein